MAFIPIEVKFSLIFVRERGWSSLQLRPYMRASREETTDPNFPSNSEVFFSPKPSSLNRIVSKTNMPSSYTASALIVLIIVSVTMASPTGAPTLACNWMRPLHIALPQTGQSPFITTPDKVLELLQ